MRITISPFTFKLYIPTEEVRIELTTRILKTPILPLNYSSLLRYIFNKVLISKFDIYY